MQTAHPFSLLDAVQAIHSADCDVWGDAPQPDAKAVSHDPNIPDDVLRYTAGARRIYADLRRLIGQLAGLLILAQASNRRDAFDLPALAAARELWATMPEQFGRLRTPHRLETHSHLLHGAHTLLGNCLAALKDPATADDRPDITVAMADLTRAYTYVQAASEPRLGMAMVDFNHACCSCGQTRK